MRLVEVRMAMTSSVFRAVEEKIGSAKDWPTYILLHLVCEEPTERVIKNVCAFMYGNRVPVHLAATCYGLCRGQRYEEEVMDAISKLYKQWNKKPQAQHIAQYYNMRDKRVYWLNGRQREQREVALPEAVVAEIGFDGAEKIGLGLKEHLLTALDLGCEEFRKVFKE